MIEVSVDEEDDINSFWVNRKRRPVAQAQLFEPLEQTTINQNTLPFCFNQVF